MKYIKDFNTVNENNLQDKTYTLDDLRKAFEAGNKMVWTDINQEEKEPYYYSFEQWFGEWNGNEEN